MDLSKYTKVRAKGADPIIHLADKSLKTLCGIESTYSNRTMQLAPESSICDKCKKIAGGKKSAPRWS